MGRSHSPLRWTDDPEGLRRQAASRLIAFVGIPETPRVLALVEQFREEQELRVVFESNHLEGAGPTSLTETRKIAKDALVERRLAPMPSAQRRLVVHRVWASRSMSRASTFRELSKLPSGVLAQRHLPVLTFEGRSRLGLEVLQHVVAIQQAQLRALRFDPKRIQYWAAMQSEEIEAEGRQPPPWPSAWPPRDELPRPRLVDQAFARRLHGVIARGLLDLTDTEGVTPGEYRVDRRGAGPLGAERWFLPPSQILHAMQQWVRRSNELSLQPGADPLHRACWIMHRFTEIHPFPDFNGRVARLLMNLSLTADGLPFPVSLPSGAKWRRRYGEALKAGDRDDLEPLMTLVAKAIVDAFERLEAQLRATGLRGIPKAPA